MANFNGIGLPNLTKRDLTTHRSSLANIQDQIYSPLYDSGNYTSGTTTSIAFFSVPRGQGTTTAPGATGTKTYADTNLQLAGQLALGNRFYATGIEFQIFPGVDPGRTGTTTADGAFVNDIYRLSKSAYVQLTIQNRDYCIDGPLLNFPPVNRLSGFATNITTASSTTAQIEYASASGAPYNIVPIYIEATQAFSVNVYWPAAVTLLSTATARIFCRLRGRLIRNAQ